MKKRCRVYGLAVIALYVVFRLFVCLKYTILTGSMLPTIELEESVYVWKPLYGWRLYGFRSKSPKHFYRIHGFRDIVPGDVILFNLPYIGNNIEKIAFNSKEEYCKRVLGTPGDRIGAVDGHYWNDKYLKPVGVLEEQERLRWMFDGYFRMINSYEVIPYSDSDWNIKNWGPVIVPAKGQTMSLDDFTRELYRKVIEYETGEPLDETLKEYTFQKDYYFAVGDNAMSSFDSRYWGFIPEDYIIGIVGGRRFRNK